MGFSPSNKHFTTASISSTIIDATTGSFTELLTVSGIGVPDPNIGNEAIVFLTPDLTAFTSGVDIIVPMAAEKQDDGNWHDNSTNNSRVTVDVAGVYSIKGVVSFSNNSTGHRFVEIYVNGASVTRNIGGPSAVSTGTVIVQDCVFVVQLQASDFIELVARATFTGSVDLKGLATYNSSRTQLQVQRIG